MEVRDATSAVYRVEPEAARADDDAPSGYKRTEVGVIPEDWSCTKLGAQVDLLTGFPFPSKGYARIGIRLLRGSNVKRGVLDWADDVTEFWPLLTPEMRRYALKEGDVVVAMDGSLVGRSFATVAPNDLPALLLQRVARLRSINFSQSYLSACVCTDRFTQHCDAVKTITAIPHISPEDIRAFWVQIPSDKDEQQAIAEALSDADALIESLQQLIAKQRAIKQGAMQAVLTGRQRLPGFTGEWQSKQLGEIAMFYKGKGLPKSALDEGGRFPCVHYGELFTRLPETIRETCSRTNWTGDTFRSLANDVLMPTSDVTPSGLAKASCVVMDGVIIGGDVLVIRTDPRIICGTFLSYVIRNSESQILQLVTGTTVFHLYASDMRKFESHVPLIAEQEAIITVLSDMDAEIEALEVRLAKTRALKAGMMQQLLTGRIRLV